MIHTIAIQLAQRLQTSIPCVVREEYEMLILKEVYNSSFGKSLIFKGGTALRLSYHSARFSEDLDFSLSQKLEYKKFVKLINSLKKYPNIVGVETRNKFNTIFGLVKIREDFLHENFSIKIEISKRKDRPWIREKTFTSQIIESETVPFKILADVASLETILKDKLDAIKNRKVVRDVFDYWFINQLFKKEVKVDLTGYDKKIAKAELHKLLPKNYWRLTDTWI